MIKRIFIFFVVLLISSCHFTGLDLTQVQSLLASDSLIIKEDSLIINEGGITFMNPINDSLCIITIDQSKVYILNYRTGVFIKQLLIPDISYENIASKINWSKEHPDFELLAIEKEKRDWIESCNYDAINNRILIYYCPVFKFRLKGGLKTQQLAQALLLSFDINGNYQNFYFISDRLKGCDSCFPGFNYYYTNIDSQYLAFNAMLLDGEKYVGSPLLSYYHIFKNNLVLDSIGKQFTYPDNFDYTFGIKIRLNNSYHLSDSRRIFEMKSKKLLFDIEKTPFGNAHIEDFTFKKDSLLILVFQFNKKEKPMVSNYIFNVQSSSIKKIPVSYSKFIYKKELIVIDKNEKDPSYKIYHYPL